MSRYLGVDDRSTLVLKIRQNTIWLATTVLTE